MGLRGLSRVKRSCDEVEGAKTCEIGSKVACVVLLVNSPNQELNGLLLAANGYKALHVGRREHSLDLLLRCFLPYLVLDTSSHWPC